MSNNEITIRLRRRTILLVLGVIVSAFACLAVGLFGHPLLSLARRGLRHLPAALRELTHRAVPTDEPIFVLCDFEKEQDAKLWKLRGAQFIRVHEHATDGQWAGRFSYPAGKGGPAAAIEDALEDGVVLGDWSSYDQLMLDIFNPQKRPGRLILQLKDHDEQRYQKDLRLQPDSLLSAAVDFNAIASTIDLSRIVKLNLFLWDPVEEATFYVDNVRLVRADSASAADVQSTGASTATSAAGITSAGSLPGSKSGATDLCAGLVQDFAPHPMTAIAKPALGQTVIDPEFGTTIRRISAVVPRNGDSAIRPMYSTTSAWNADESLLVLYDVGVGHKLYHGRTYAFLRALNIHPPDLEQVYWDTSNPDILYFPSDKSLYRYHVASDLTELVRKFAFCTGNVAADSHAFMSWDNNVIGLRCDDQDFLYRLSDDTVGRTTSARGAPFASASGTYAYWEGDVVDSTMNVVRKLDLGNPAEHAALGRYQAGHDTYNLAQYDPGPLGSEVGSLVTFDLTDSTWKVVVGPATGFPYPPSGTHISTLAYQKPGWVFLSVVGDPAGQGVLDNEILLADTSTGKVCRLAHHRSWGKNNDNFSKPYWCEPHVTASPSGTRAVFASDWGGGSTVDTYVIELPSYVHTP